jgi:hypothetical protein
MEGTAYLFMLIGVALLLRWFLVHDKKPGEKTGGLFAMREPVDRPAATGTGGADTAWRPRRR